MNTKPQLIVSILSCIILMSCQKVDSQFCVAGDMEPIEPGTYEYTWCGTQVDQVEWQLWDGTTKTGSSVSLTFDAKTNYDFTVETSRGGKKKKESFSIEVGGYQARVEPKMCNQQRLSGENYFAYLYDDLTNLKKDLGYGASFFHVAGRSLKLSKYYNGTYNDYDAAVCGFSNVESGNYFIYIIDTETGDNNLIDIIQGTSSTIEIQNGKQDDIANPIVNVNSNGNEHLKNLIGETFIMTNSWVNSTNQGVPLCNMDDKFTFNLDGSFTHDIGADDCGGIQLMSTGSYYFPGSCADLSSEPISLVAEEGNLDGQTISLEFQTPRKFKVSMTIGQDNVVHEYTAE